ncbi:MAG: MFS transporter [Chloroflexi bacterium]|nr:MFS transporter [Chloroflexota bacterium]
MLSRSFVVLWIAMAVAVMGIAMVSPLLPVFVREELHGPEFAVALSFSAIAISQIATSPVVGRFADKFGPKPFIVLGFFVYGAGGVGFIFSQTWEQVIFFRALSGVGAASMFPTTMAYVGRLAPPGFEGRYMGAFSISWIAGFGIGPLFGGTIRDFVSSDAAFATMSLMLFAVGVAVFLLLPKGQPGAGTDREYEEEALEPGLPMIEVLKRPIVHAAIGGHMVVSIGWGAGFTFIAVYVVSDDGLATGSATFAGVLLAARALFTAGAQLITGPLADRMNRVFLSVLGFGIAGGAQFIVPDIPGVMTELSIFGGTLVIVPWLLLLFLVVGLGESIEFPAQQAIFVDAGRAVGMGTIMGITQTAGGVGFLAGSMFGALVVGIWGLDAVFRYAGLAMFLGGFGFWLLMIRAKRDFAMLEAAAAADLRARYAPEARGAAAPVAALTASNGAQPAHVTHYGMSETTQPDQSLRPAMAGVDRD